MSNESTQSPYHYLLYDSSTELTKGLYILNSFY